MKGFMLIIFVVVAVPYALGIRCYDCKIKSIASLCDKTLSNDTNAVNCSGIFDTCVSTALTIKSKLGNLEKSAYMMTCGQKSIGCSKIETDNCGREGFRKFINKIPFFEVTKCGVACCDSDMCNKADIVKPKPMTESLGVSTSARSVFVVSGIIFTVGLIL